MTASHEPSRLGEKAAAGLEQLGLLRSRRPRGRGQGQRRLHGGQDAELRLGVRRSGHPVVRARRRFVAVPQVRAARDGRLVAPRARAEPLPLLGRGGGLRAPGRLRARPRPQVRHPHHARHPPPGRPRRDADSRVRGHRARRRPSNSSVPGTPTCTGSIRKRLAPAPITARSSPSTPSGASISSRSTTFARRDSTARTRARSP